MHEAEQKPQNNPLRDQYSERALQILARRLLFLELVIELLRNASRNRFHKYGVVRVDSIFKQINQLTKEHVEVIRHTGREFATEKFPIVVDLSRT